MSSFKQKDASFEMLTDIKQGVEWNEMAGIFKTKCSTLEHILSEILLIMSAEVYVNFVTHTEKLGST